MNTSNQAFQKKKRKGRISIEKIQLKMAKSIEIIDLKNKLDNHECDDIDYEKQVDGDLYPKLDNTTIISSTKTVVPQSNATPQQQQSCVLQQTTVSVHSNGHSRNPSSINGITIATQVIQPPPNKPDAFNSLLKLIRFRSDYEEHNEKSQSRQICGMREARIFSK